MAFVWTALLFGLLFCTSVCTGKVKIIVLVNLYVIFFKYLHELGKPKEQDIEPNLTLYFAEASRNNLQKVVV